MTRRELASAASGFPPVIECPQCGRSVTPGTSPAAAIAYGVCLMLSLSFLPALLFVDGLLYVALLLASPMWGALLWFAFPYLTPLVPAE